MDKLKPTIEFIKKHLFWILCGIVFLVTMMTYYLGSTSLRNKQQAAETKINANYQKVSGVRKAGDGFHPNEETHIELVKLTNAARAELAKAWELKEEAQRPLFVWPKEIGTAAEEFADLRPIEKKVPFEQSADNSEVKENYRGNYRDLVKNALPPLAAKIGEVWLPELQREGVLESRKTAINKARRVVMWDEENQEYWEKKFTNFKNGYNRDERGIPWTVQVYYAQEDMWILQSILEDIIKKTNGDAVANDLAKIKAIDHIFIGRDAQGIVGDVFTPGKKDAQGGTSGGGMSMEDQMKMMGSGMGGGGMGGAVTGMGGGGLGGIMGNTGPVPGKTEGQVGDGTADPANGRYVDQNLEPVGGKQLREAFTKVTAESAYLSIAKRVPVRIGLQMDERAIWDLMANCANARLPLEVKQVRINAHEPGIKGNLASKFSEGESKGPAQGGNQTGGEGDAAKQVEQMSAMARNAAGAGADGTGGAVRSQAALGGYDVPVEIYGIIYLYNPVDDDVVKQIPIGDEGSSDMPAGPSASLQPPVGRLRS